MDGSIASLDKEQDRFFAIFQFLGNLQEIGSFFNRLMANFDNDVTLELQTSVDTSAHNVGVITEGHKRHFKIREVAQEEHSGYWAVETLEKRRIVILRSGFYYVIGGKKTYAPDNVLSLKLKKRTPFLLGKRKGR